MRRFVAGLLLTYAAAACGDASGPSGPVPVRFTDPAGDTVAAAVPTVRANDVVATQITVLADTLLLQIELAAAVSPWSLGQPNGFDGFLDFDVDNNALTGIPAASNQYGVDAQLGAEWFLDFRDDGAGTIDLANAVNTSQRVAVPIRFLGSIVEIRVPRAALGETDGRFGMAYIVEMEDRPVSDFVPNAGHYAIAPPQSN
jgi:hypothetical protein